MNARLLACIAMGVFTAHIGIIMLLAHLRPKVRVEPPLPRNFKSSAEIVAVDPVTGTKTVERQITVTTKLADPRPVEPAASR